MKQGLLASESWRSLILGSKEEIGHEWVGGGPGKLGTHSTVVVRARAGVNLIHSRGGVTG